MKWILLAGLAIAPGLASAQVLIQNGRVAAIRPSPTSATDPNASLKPGSVEGVVTNSASGEPLPKATVTLRNIAQSFTYSAATDASGSFAFHSVEPGVYQMSANRSGFMQDQTARTKTAGSPLVTVAEAQDVKNTNVQLLPLAVIDGKVLDEDGDPIVNASIQALQYFYTRSRKQFTTSGSASTNDLGEFEMLDLRPGTYYFRVTATPFRPSFPPHTQGAPPEMAYPEMFYPNAADLSQATPTSVAPGAHLTEIDFRLAKTRAYHIRGRVVDTQSDVPMQSVTISLLPSSGDEVPGFRVAARVAPDGTFDLRDAISGNYNLFARAATRDKVEYASQPVSVGETDVDGVVLRLAPTLDLSGSLQVEGTPAAGSARMEVLLESPEAGLATQGFSGYAMVANDGTFTVRNLVPGAYQVEALGSIPGKYLKTIRFGDQDVPSGRMNLTEAGGAITLVFGADPGQLRGTVQTASGTAAPNAEITLVPEGDHAGRPDLCAQTVADSNGNFVFQSLAPGQYKLFAWEQVDPNMVWSPDFRKPFENDAGSVTIEAGQNQTVQVKWISADDVAAAKDKQP